MQCTSDVLLCCTLETCMLLQTEVNPINAINNILAPAYMSQFAEHQQEAAKDVSHSH